MIHDVKVENELKAKLEQAKLDRLAITANIQKLELEIEDAKKDRPVFELAEVTHYALSDGNKRLIIRYDKDMAISIEKRLNMEGGMFIFNISTGELVNYDNNKNHITDFYSNYRPLEDVS